MNFFKKIYHHRQIFRKKPWVAQALWIIPIFWLLKNLIDTLIIGKDIISERRFTIKEKFFKTLSALFSLCFWWIVIYYSMRDNLNTYILLSLTTLLQAGNWWCYIIGVYFSGELQNIIFRQRSAFREQTNKVLTTAKTWAKKVIITTKESTQTIWNTIKKVRIKRK